MLELGGRVLFPGGVLDLVAKGRALHEELEPDSREDQDEYDNGVDDGDDVRLDDPAAAAPRELVVDAKDPAPTWSDPGAGRRKVVVVARRAEQERKGDINEDEDEDDLSMVCNDTDAGYAAMVV
jgi:hypothetical protein